MEDCPPESFARATNMERLLSVCIRWKDSGAQRYLKWENAVGSEVSQMPFTLFCCLPYILYTDAFIGKCVCKDGR